jgi:hypothetical protein
MTHKGPPPIVWRCPDCNAGLSSRYAQKNHVCGGAQLQATPARAATAYGNGGRS